MNNLILDINNLIEEANSRSFLHQIKKKIGKITGVRELKIGAKRIVREFNKQQKLKPGEIPLNLLNPNWARKTNKLMDSGSKKALGTGLVGVGGLYLYNKTKNKD
jgi:hypothetical protein